jgi:hypothetical protein
MPDEEARAAEFRRTMTARAEWDCEQRFSALPGDSDRRSSLAAAWDPWTNPIRDWDVVDCADGGGTIVRTPIGLHVRGAGRQLV